MNTYRTLAKRINKCLVTHDFGSRYKVRCVKHTLEIYLLSGVKNDGVTLMIYQGKFSAGQLRVSELSILTSTEIEFITNLIASNKLS